MKKKAGFVMNEVCGEKYLVAEGIENVDFNHIISLNETAAFLWEAMGEGEFTVADLVKKLTDEYEVSDKDAEDSIDALLNQLKESGLVED